MMVTKTEWLDWLRQSPDATGECDRCHTDNVALWALPMELDKEPDAAWLYCRSCFRRIVQAAK